MLASGCAPICARARSRPPGLRLGEVRVLPDAVAQHRMRVFELAGIASMRRPNRAEAAAVEAEGLPERLDVRLLGQRDRTRAQGLRRRHRLLADRARDPLRHDVARRSFLLQIEHFRAALQEPKRTRLLPQPPAFVPLLTRRRYPPRIDRPAPSRSGHASHTCELLALCLRLILDALEVEAMGRSSRAGSVAGCAV
jgi:hypothetical protein